MTTATQPSSQPHKNYIGRAWANGAKIAPDINPSDTNDVVGQYTYGDAGQANAAVTAAKDAFLAWSRSSIQLRHDILKRVGDEILARKDELGRLLSREEGKTLPKASARWCGRAKSSCFFPANACVSSVTKSLRCDPASTWM
jgi:acyl-CoA reductase-like NAD-dependent aldehyde dehydrogenase